MTWSVRLEQNGKTLMVIQINNFVLAYCNVSMTVQEHSALVCNSGITTHMRLLIRISNEQQLSSKAELELKPENTRELARGLNWVGLGV